jgi:exosome complex component MTR3
MHLENALKGAIIPDRWPKSAIDVAVTVLEGEEDEQGPADRISGVGLFNVLAGCINVAMAALADARVDCLDLLVAGVGALVVPNGQRADSIRVLDPAPAEHGEIVSSCVVGYLPSRDEVVEVWSLGSALPEGAGHGGGAGGGGQGFEQLVDGAIAASLGAQSVLKEVLLESMVRNDSLVSTKKDSGHHQLDDVEMKT